MKAKLAPRLQELVAGAHTALLRGSSVFFAWASVDAGRTDKMMFFCQGAQHHAMKQADEVRARAHYSRIVQAKLTLWQYYAQASVPADVASLVAAALVHRHSLCAMQPSTAAN